MFETLASMMAGVTRETGWKPDVIFGEIPYIQLLLLINRWSQEAEELEIEQDFAEATNIEIDTMGFFSSVLEKDGRINLSISQR